jgi:hypothetical protein
MDLTKGVKAQRLKGTKAKRYKNNNSPFEEGRGM